MSESQKFVERLNEMIAPVTKAWKEIEIVSVTIDREGFAVGPDELCVDVRLILKKGTS